MIIIAQEYANDNNNNNNLQGIKSIRTINKCVHKANPFHIYPAAAAVAAQDVNVPNGTT